MATITLRKKKKVLSRPAFPTTQNAAKSVRPTMCALDDQALALRAFHWQPVRRTKKMAFIVVGSGTRASWQLNGCGFRGGNSGATCSHHSSGHRYPSSCLTMPTMSSIRNTVLDTDGPAFLLAGKSTKDALHHETPVGRSWRGAGRLRRRRYGMVAARGVSSTPAYHRKPLMRP